MNHQKSDSIVSSPSGSKYTDQKCTSGGKYGNKPTTKLTAFV